MYKVIRTFTDLEDKRRLCEVGHSYPRKGLEPTPERIEALTSSDNKIGKPVIEEIDVTQKDDQENIDPEIDVSQKDGPSDEEFPKPTKEGSTWYVLSNGEKVNGKAAAIEAEDKLKSGE